MSKKQEENKKACKTSIGGQAVLEGVMMRGQSSMATAVRDADGIIRLETKRITPAKNKNIFLRLPVIRGVVAFVSSLFTGMKVLMRSAEVYGEEEPSRFEKWMAEKLKVNIFSFISALSVLLGVFLAIFLFMWLPQTVRIGLENIFNHTFSLWAKNFIEGGLKLTIFILYIIFCLCIKDVRRTFMYHGAEHKTISCFEKGLGLNVDNVRRCKRVHNRCGTTLIVFVMVISIVTFAIFESIVGESVQGILRVCCKVLILPLVAGLSYELLKALAKTDNPIFYPLKVPGLLLQRLTTKEPTDEMIEVAITSFNKVLEMDEDQSIPECSFVVPEKRKVLLERVVKTLKENGIEESSEAEWIVSIVLGVKRSELYTENLVTPKFIEEIDKIVSQRITGKPLWYCIGDTEFYGYKIKVDHRVLIPRPETELLVAKALPYINNNSKVLDLCTGSGAIAIAINKESGASVIASDISEEALLLARENAQLNQAQVKFVHSDLFERLEGNRFDMIISNPPYIKREVISSLQNEVKNFEPILALDGGIDGLDFYKAIAEKCRDFLTNNGIIMLEIGYDQAQEVCALFSDFSSVEVIKDYEGNDRIIKAVL